MPSDASSAQHRSIAHLFVGVADMNPVRELWVQRFGLETVAELTGPDAELARLWGLPPDAIAAQLLLRTPGASSGWLHFVQFAVPAAPVRAAAQPTDLCPKNIDVNCVDMPARHAELAAAGYRFRSAISAYEIAGMQACEVQMPAHDDINVVLIEVADWPVQLSAQHFGAVTSFVSTVPDTAAEGRFYHALLGLEELLQHRIAGPAIEEVVGLPAGAALHMRLLGDPGEVYGRLELIAYEQIKGRDLYPRARPPALGILGCRFRTDNVLNLRERAVALGVPVTACGRFELLFGCVELIRLRSPAGLALEIFSMRAPQDRG
ncbi:MAG: hypothetical protein V2J12_03450 [Gammaproteobacteria bacterium]|jgi:catechol 2,3-dioxygenase-like lactoylglutathione lyase family enzyme|nr:hypothetical protein [Gammaproteobacteria bacterium]